MTTTAQHGFEQEIDALTARLDALITRIDAFLEREALTLHRLDLVESCHPLEHMEDRRGF